MINVMVILLFTQINLRQSLNPGHFSDTQYLSDWNFCLVLFSYKKLLSTVCVRCRRMFSQVHQLRNMRFLFSRGLEVFIVKFNTTVFIYVSYQWSYHIHYFFIVQTCIMLSIFIIIQYKKMYIVKKARHPIQN